MIKSIIAYYRNKDIPRSERIFSVFWYGWILVGLVALAVRGLIS